MTDLETTFQRMADRAQARAIARRKPKPRKHPYEIHMRTKDRLAGMTRWQTSRNLADLWNMPISTVTGELPRWERLGRIERREIPDYKWRECRWEWRAK